MKIKTKQKSYREVLELPHAARKKPRRQLFFWRWLMRLLSGPDLHATHFQYKKIGMEHLGKKQPALFLMNHSSFIDLKVSSALLGNRPYNIVCTTDGFVGKRFLMRSLGCIPTDKFLPDLRLVRDMLYAVNKLKSSVLMFPEAGYSFDGTSTLLPDSLGKCAKLLKVPVVMIRTEGAFARQPLYNDLHRRHVNVSAEMEYLLSPEDIEQKSAEELNAIIEEKFQFDAFRWQQENKIAIEEPNRAEGLHRLLYKCPICMAEGKTESKGTTLLCQACGKEWELDPYGYLTAEGDPVFPHVPDWYAWERECVRRELTEGTYSLETDVDIYVLTDTKCLYHTGGGHLSHSRAGFHLVGEDGVLDYTQDPLATYSLNADFNWYELGDVIGIGKHDMLYYCIPKDPLVSVTKARLATEELYRTLREENRLHRLAAQANKAN